MAKSEKHKWTFAPRFRKNAFGWQSQPAVKRVREAVTEIKKTARKNPVLAAEGAVVFLEKVSPALAHVDSSSGSIGSAVNRAIEALVPIIASAPADAATRGAWLERLWEAHEADDVPYIESLADDWGELCASRDVASEWADRLLDTTRRALGPERGPGDFFHGTSACLSALFRAERHEEIIDVLAHSDFWPYKRWAVKALAASGKRDDAIRQAEALRGPWASDLDIDRHCEEILLADGLVDEAYARYGLTANRAGTYLAWFRAVTKKYPHKDAGEILADLVKVTPGEEGKWFAAAKDAGLYDQAVELARTTPCDPRTLTRAARDFVSKNPAFALEAGLAALSWLVLGYGYEITGADVRGAYEFTMKAAEQVERREEVHSLVRELVARETFGERFVTRILGRELGLS